MRDSLQVLPVVRREAGSWRRAAGRYRLAADTAQAAYLRQVATTESSQFAYHQQLSLTTRETLRAEDYRTKAHRRGLWNWLLAVGLGGLTYGFVTR